MYAVYNTDCLTKSYTEVLNNIAVKCQALFKEAFGSYKTETYQLGIFNHPDFFYIFDMENGRNHKSIIQLNPATMYIQYNFNSQKKFFSLIAIRSFEDNAITIYKTLKALSNIEELPGTFSYDIQQAIFGGNEVYYSFLSSQNPKFKHLVHNGLSVNPFNSIPFKAGTYMDEPFYLIPARPGTGTISGKVLNIQYNK